MAGTKFDDSFDPAFEVRAAEMSKTATVQQETADAVDGGNVHVSAPEPVPAGGNDDSTIEQIGGNLGDAAGDALLAAASVAPPLAAAAAVIDQGEALLDAGKDVANFAGDAVGTVGGAFGDLFGGGDDVPPGTSTFNVDPNAPTSFPGSEEEREALQASGDAARAGQEHFNERGGGGGYVFNADPDDHVQADPYLELDTGIAGAGAAGANAVTAPDGAYEPVSASDPHTSVGGGFMPEPSVDAGAPDGAYEPVSDSDPHTSVGFVPTGGADAGAPDGVFEPVSESDPHTSVGGADVGAPDGVFEPVSESDPHTSVGGADVGAPDGVFEPVSESDPHTSVGGADAGAPDGVFEPVSDSDPHTSVGFVPTGGVDLGAPDGVFEPVSESDPHTSVGGADAGAPDGAFEPVADSDPHTSVGFVPDADDLPTVDGVQTDVPVGSDVELNPQPIPPGMGADIGEPVAAASAAAPSTTDSSIIIVGGTEAGFGSDGGAGDAVSLNPQPIPPGIDLHPPSPIAPAGADVSLNPQPIPPGMGADIGEPVADVAAAAPSTTDSSIIIVGGTEAPVFSDVSTAVAEAPVVADIEVADAPMEDVASSIAVELDGPSFSAEDGLDAPVEMSIDEAVDG